MDTFHSLRTPRLLLSRVQAGDLDDFVRFYADPDVTATLGGARTAEWVAQYLETQMAHWDQHGFGFWTLRDPLTGQFVGRGGLRYATVEGKVEIEVGYGLMREFWGRGLATELAIASLDVGFVELRRPDLVCFTLPTNAASRRVMEKAGFRFEREIVYADLPHVLFRLTAADWRAGQGREPIARLNTDGSNSSTAVPVPAGFGAVGTIGFAS
jgi:RimJ/RimL family protein N-acetyltransferase